VGYWRGVDCAVAGCVAMSLQQALSGVHHGPLAGSDLAAWRAYLGDRVHGWQHHRLRSVQLQRLTGHSWATFSLCCSMDYPVRTQRFWPTARQVRVGARQVLRLLVWPYLNSISEMHTITLVADAEGLLVLPPQYCYPACRLELVEPVDCVVIEYQYLNFYPAGTITFTSV